MKVVLHRLLEEGLIQLLESKPLPNPLPANFDTSVYCELHRTQGHDTEQCMKLRHVIQNLIDNRKISPPATQAPNVNINPLPDHRVVPLPAYNNINLIECDLIYFDPSVVIVPKGSPMPKVIIPDFLLVSMIGDDLWYEDPNKDCNEVFRVIDGKSQENEGASSLWAVSSEGIFSGPVIIFEELNAKVGEVFALLASLRVAQQTNHLT